jgi:hypothetical protein
VQAVLGDPGRTMGWWMKWAEGRGVEGRGTHGMALRAASLRISVGLQMLKGSSLFFSRLMMLQPSSSPTEAVVPRWDLPHSMIEYRNRE